MIFKNIFRHKIISRLPLLLSAIGMSVVLALPASAEPKKSTKTQDRDFIVVLDAGHGGHDTGAVDNGAKEKDINLGVARKVAKLVRKKLKNSKVVMTRDDDTFVSLQERANIANRNRANLFVSIHSNSVDKSNPNRKTVSGASVYALGLHKDQSNLKVAMRENAVIELENNYKQKYSGFDPSKDESYIIFEMSQKKNLGNSLKFANAAQKQLVKVAGRADRGVKQAGFWVLWATSMPSVLIELDFICNPQSAAFMNSEEGQEKLAEAIYNAIVTYSDSYFKPAASAMGVPEKVKEEEAGDVTAAVAPESLPAAGPGADSGVLASVPDKRKTSAPKYSPAKGAAPSSRARKRRSGSSKRLSEGRAIETENIPLFSETSYMALSEAPADVDPEPQVNPDDRNPKNKKSKKKNKDKKNKEKLAKEKKEKEKQAKEKKAKEKKTPEQTPASSPKHNKHPGKKTYLVASNGQVSNVNDNRGVRSISRTVYKVQVLASPEKLDFGNSCFCGLSPVECFQENGLYKYTYGKSTSRAEIEDVLLSVKSKIPDAFIIVSHE